MQTPIACLGPLFANTQLKPDPSGRFLCKVPPVRIRTAEGQVSTSNRIRIDVSPPPSVVFGIRVVFLEPDPILLLANGADRFDVGREGMWSGMVDGIVAAEVAEHEAKGVWIDLTESGSGRVGVFNVAFERCRSFAHRRWSR